MRNVLTQTRQRGFNLMEVVVAIFIFVVALLALSSLQGALTRTMADSKMRTEGATIAESIIEAQRGFTQLESGGAFAYQDIASWDAPQTVTASDGMTYTVNQVVTDYYFDRVTDDFSTTPTKAGGTLPEYKDVAVTVSWVAAEFRGTENLDAADRDLGSGEITVRASIPRLATTSTTRVVQEDPDTELPTPATLYEPGDNPDVIKLSLGDNKFKESLFPLPEVLRTDDLTETTFDVITYSTGVGGSVFLRREEFTTVSCECVLNAASSDNPGRRPVVWAGDEYAGGQWVEKRYGTQNNSTQSSLCEACCRDHHDGGSATEDHGADAAYNRYGPFKAATEHLGDSYANDHRHYLSDGETEAVTSGQAKNRIYLEACRMVRVDGFFQVAQDFHREDEFVFPEDFLDDTGEVDTYSAYATSGATAYYGAATDNYSISATPPCIGDDDDDPDTASSCALEPSLQTLGGAITVGQFPSWTSLLTGSVESQQLRSRGIYIDYLSKDLRTYMQQSPSGCLSGTDIVNNCCVLNGAKTSDADCDDPRAFILDQTGSSNLLEVIPFFDVQLTFLNRWAESPVNIPVDATNEPLETITDPNSITFSRGVITNSQSGASKVTALSHRGNIGFTDTIAIDPVYSNNVTEGWLIVNADGGGVIPVTGTSPIYAGTITEDVGSQVNNIVVTGLNGAQCNNTAATWQCAVPIGSSNPEAIVSGFGAGSANPEPRWVCDPAGVLNIQNTALGINPTGTVDLTGLTEGVTYVLNVQNVSCDSL